MLMMKRNPLSLLFFTLFLTCCGAETSFAQATAQATVAVARTPSTGFRAEVLNQIADAEKKLIALAEAIPQEKYSYRPGEGVRSTSEVFMHVAGGNFMITSFVGAKPPEGLSRDMEKLTDKAKVVDMLKQSFEHVRQAVLNTSDADLEKATKLFGRDTTYRDVLLLLATHAHEHLGQTIAYARMSGITPPWTQARQSQTPRPPQ
ncbi:MAG: DinB family protein [Pyrinomonadaceae bacterium]